MSTPHPLSRPPPEPAEPAAPATHSGNGDFEPDEAQSTPDGENGGDSTPGGESGDVSPGPPHAPRLRPRAERVAAAALACVYLASMSGHLMSMDGLYMLRQSYSLVFEQSVRFEKPVWTWRDEPTTNSIYGIGLSVLYVPGLLPFSTIYARVPVSVAKPRSVNDFYLRELYEDPLYTIAGAWIHALLAATTAYLVSRFVLALGFGHGAALWALAFYGLGSSTLVYARGDFAQLPEALFWVAALLAVVRFRDERDARQLVACAALLACAILTRPIEGLLLAPTTALLAVPAQTLRRSVREAIVPLLALAAGVAVGVVGTLLVNWARFGSALEFGYPEGNTWGLPGLMRWAAVLVSPGRGILWEFPALLLVPAGAIALWRAGRRAETSAMLVLAFALLANVAAWAAWWGGWCWGLRLYAPAVPLLAVLAGIGAASMGSVTRRFLAPLLLLAGLFWALPGVFTDILGGYGSITDQPDFAWLRESYPPLGAWQFLDHAFADSATDFHAVDILWFRLAKSTGYWSLLVPAVLLAVAAAFALRVRRELRREQGEATTALPS